MGILDLVAGAAAEAGTGLGKMGLASILQDQAAAVQAARDARLESFAAAREQRGYAHQEKTQKTGILASKELQTAGFTQAKDLQSAGFKHDTELLTARQTFDEEQKGLDRDLTREQIESNKEIAIANRANAIEAAKIGGVIQPDPEGNVFMVGKDGTTKQIMDPRDPTKPLKTAKNMTPAQTTLSAVIKDRLKGLDANQLMDPTEKAKQTAVLNEQLLTVITQGVGGLGKGAGGVEPPQAAIDMLKANPKLAEAFRAKYPGADPEKYLTPAAKVVASRPLQDVTTAELTKRARRPKGTSPAEASEAQRELDRRKGEDRLGTF